MKFVSFRIDEELLQHLNAYSKGNKTTFIIDALNTYIQSLKNNNATIRPKHQNRQDSIYIDMYIDQLKSRLHRTEGEVEYWKNLYNTLQTEYQNQIKDSNKRSDDKFDRIMFIIEESRKIVVTPVLSRDDIQEKQESYDSCNPKDRPLAAIVNKVKERKKKGWVFEMYRLS